MGANERLVHRQLTEQIIGAAMEVHRALGPGFMEKVYENALAVELQARNLKVEQQKAVTVYYKNKSVGEYIADVIVNDAVILELKTVEQLVDIHQAQILNYLKATGFELGLLINFRGPSLEWKRIVLQSELSCFHNPKIRANPR